MDGDQVQGDKKYINPWEVYQDRHGPTIQNPKGFPPLQQSQRENILNEPIEDIEFTHERHIRESERNEQEGRGRRREREGEQREKGHNSPSRMSGKQRSVSTLETTGIMERSLLRTDKNHSQQQHQQYLSLSSSQRSFQGSPSRQVSPSRQDRRYSTTSLMGMNERHESKQIERRNSRSVGQPSSSRHVASRSRSPRANQTTINYRDRGSQIPVSQNLQQISVTSTPERRVINSRTSSPSARSPQKKIPDCNICGNSFRFERDSTLHKERQMECEDESCKEKFCNMKDRGKHYENYHPGQLFLNLDVYKCKECPRTFHSPGGLTSHKRFHGTALFKCKYCNEPFSREYDRDAHEIDKLVKWVCLEGCTNQDNSRVGFCCEENLKRHHIERHNGIHFQKSEQHLICKFCSVTMLYKPEFLRHLEGCGRKKKQGSK